MDSKSASVRKKLDHPVIDGDGHWLEPVPVYLEYLCDIGGPKAVDALVAYWKSSRARWYELSVEDRGRMRISRPPWWSQPGTALDRATGLIPSLFHERLDEFGIDFSVVYPSMGPSLFHEMHDSNLRIAFVRALNKMSADLFKPYAARMTPVALVPMFTPQEAIEEADFAVRQLGMKAVAINGTVHRNTADDGADGKSQTDRAYIDCLALDSRYDYDPVWKKFLELKVAVTSHTGSMGWANRTSPSNFVANHVGHFAEAHHYFARGLFLGGVPQRFPSLAFGFLEGGAGWGCNFYSDMLGHWKKRNKKYMHAHLKPTNIDKRELRTLLDRYVKEEVYRRNIDNIVERNHDCVQFDRTDEELAQRDNNSDEFAAANIGSQEDIDRIFSRNFYFGCEADDPMTSVAFDRRHGFPVRPVFSSDISHWDVPDPSAILEEAWEPVEAGLMTTSDFRKFTFENAVALHTASNPGFFDGTVIERQVTDLLGKHRIASS